MGRFKNIFFATDFSDAAAGAGWLVFATGLTLETVVVFCDWQPAINETAARADITRTMATKRTASQRSGKPIWPEMYREQYVNPRNHD